MSSPPQTRLFVTPEEERRIRSAVKGADVALLGPGYRPATAQDAEGLLELLADPEVSNPIHDLPRPLTHESIRSWVLDAQARQRQGEAVFAIMIDSTDEIVSYSYFTVWPERSSAEIAGAYRGDAQSMGAGKAGAACSFDWMFEHLGVRLIGVTAAIDNVRSAKVIEAAGFTFFGERDSVRPDGSTRQSRYWEMMRKDWRKLKAQGH